MKRKTAAKSETAPTTAAATGVWRFATASLGGSVLAFMVLGAYLLLQLVPGAGRAVDDQVGEHMGKAYAAVFDGRILELERRLAAVAALPEVRAALLGADPVERARVSRQLEATLEFTSRVELFAPDNAALDTAAAVPISYTALDVIKRAQRGRFAGPEAMRADQVLIYAAGPVQDGADTLGVVFVAIKPAFFLTPLARFEPALGNIVLEQAFDKDNPITVVSWGEAGADTTPKQLKLAAPQWRVTFTPAGTTSGAAPGTLGAVVALAVGLLLALGSGYLAFQRLNTALRHDAMLLEALLRGDAAAAGDVPQLDALKPLPGKLAASLQAAAPAVARAARAEGQAAPADSDENPLEIEPEVDTASGPAEPEPPEIAAEIFRAYDIRGVTGATLTEEAVYWIGRAFAGQAVASGFDQIVVGRDGRHSSRALSDALIRGLSESGGAVVDIGETPTPVLYYATHAHGTGTGIMVTGSHNAPEYNGLKLVLGGETLAGDRIQALRERIARGNLPTGAGHVESVDLQSEYLERIVSDVIVAQPLKVVVDCGNGVAGRIAPELVTRLDCEVVPLYCDLDGNFPNHHPDPADPANLQDLITVVKAEGADLGLAFDGDGDRLGMVTASGRIIWPDQMLMLFAQDIVGRNPGADIIYDVKCSRHLNGIISELGGRPIMWKTGHSHIKAKLKETGALLAGEFSGHFCFGDRWYGFDDALYSAARLLEILGAAGESVDAVFDQLPQTFSTPELKVATTEEAKFGLVERLVNEGDFRQGAITTIDGLRVDYEDGWGLVRASNTSPYLTLRFEADSQSSLERIQTLFESALQQIDPALSFR